MKPTNKGNRFILPLIESGFNTINKTFTISTKKKGRDEVVIRISFKKRLLTKETLKKANELVHYILALTPSL